MLNNPLDWLQTCAMLKPFCERNFILTKGSKYQTTLFYAVYIIRVIQTTHLYEL